MSLLVPDIWQKMNDAFASVFGLIKTNQESGQTGFQ